MNDIEDFLKSKSSSGLDNYNNIDYTKYDLNKCKILFDNLLSWLHYNQEYISIGNNNKLVKLFEKELNKEIRSSKMINIRKSILLNVLNNLIDINDFDKSYEDYFKVLKLLLRKKPCRNLSGITSITVLTAPFPNGQKFSCKHDCFYCPNEPAHKDNDWQAQPRSYLYKEPAVKRANRWKFNAIGQMFDRMDTYFSNGHVIDKLEIIIEGGTYTEYPVDYLEIYHRDLFYAANIYFELRRQYPNYDDFNTQMGGLDLTKLKNIRQPLSVQEEIIINKTADVHIIGVCIETRPDAINDDWLWRFRNWGVTRVQLGLQHVDNSILKKINRGHTVEKALWAINYLKDNCFKIDIHIMPDLPGATPEIDKQMFDYVYSIVCPDQMKVYPCEVVPWTKIEQWYKDGKYLSYFEKNNDDLINVVRYSMETCPNWVRLPRVIRDIPVEYVQCGNNIANLRQVIDNKLEDEGVISRDIRSREIGRNSKYYAKPANYNTYYYYANNGHEYFICYESFDKMALFGFIRLRILEKKNMNIFNVLKDRALIRELHVYGDTTAVNAYDKHGCQHNGIGTGLLNIAEKIAMQNNIYGIAVISGEGVKSYYEKKGYYEQDTFMIKNFNWFQVWFYFILNYIYSIFSYFNLKV